MRSCIPREDRRCVQGVRRMVEKLLAREFCYWCVHCGFILHSFVEPSELFPWCNGYDHRNGRELRTHLPEIMTRLPDRDIVHDGTWSPYSV